MKKKLLCLLMTVLMLVSCVFAIVGCGGGGVPKPFNEETWKETINGNNFDISSDGSTWSSKRTISFADESYSISWPGETIYSDRINVEYGKEEVDGLQKYYNFDTNDDELEYIEDSQYNNIKPYFQPLINFIRDLFPSFVMQAHPYDEGTQFYTYTGDIPAEVITILETFRGETYTNNGIFVHANYDNLYGIYFMDAPYTIDAFIQHDSDNFKPFVELSSFGSNVNNASLKEYRKALMTFMAYENVADLENGKVNFVVKGGKDVDYKEFYFTDKGMRFYTPNAVDTPGIDGIFYNDNGTYKYYKMTKEGVWSVEEIDEDRFEDTIEQFYMDYCGGKWFEMRPNPYEVKGSTWELGEYTGKISVYSATYKNIKLKLNSDNKIISASWKLNLSFMNQQFEYSYNLTVGNAVINLPNI